MTDAFTLLEGLCKQATPGAYDVAKRRGKTNFVELVAERGKSTESVVLWGKNNVADAAYIAALAPETVLAMIEALRAADALIADAENKWGDPHTLRAARNARARLESLLSKGSL